MTIPDVDELTGMSVQDAALWRGARTLSDLGELTARWLEGSVGSVPGTVPGYGPDEETGPLVPVLAVANRAGFVTNFSQPGEDDSGWIQRAAVYGFASAATFRAITAAAADADLIITAARANGANWSTRIVVTVDNGRENTWVGDAWSHGEIQDCYGGCCDPVAVEALCQAWQITLIDPQWASNDHLWAVLRTLGR
jgi:hypothetical protein